MTDIDRLLIRTWSAIAATGTVPTAEAIAQRSLIPLFIVRGRLLALYAEQQIPASGGVVSSDRDTTGRPNESDLAPRKKRPFQKKWICKFPCGHVKMRKTCETCLALRRPRSRPIAERLAEKTDRSGGPDACWLWKGSMGGLDSRAQIGWEGRMQNAARAAWFVSTGEKPPPRMYVCHRCDNPSCVNPAHLFLGTPSDNQRDCVAKGRNVLTRILDQALVPKIKEQADAGVRTAEIAAEFGVSTSSVRRIARGAYPYRDKRSA